MNPLLRRLAILRLKVRALDGWQGICALVTLVLTVGVAVGTLDYFVHLPTLARAAVLVGLLVGSAAIVYRYLVRPFGKPCSDLNLALRVEEEFPELNDALATTVQFLSQSKEERARLGASEPMRDRTVQDTIERAAKYDFARILNRRAALLFGVAALCALGVAAWMGAYHRAHAQTAFWRLAEPFGMHTWTQVVVYRATPFEAIDGDKDKQWEALDPNSAEADRIAIGRPYIIKVLLTGQIPKQARVEILGKIRADMTIAKLNAGEDGQSAFFVTPINMTQQYQEFQFRVVANDGSFPSRAGAWHKVQVMHKPRLIDLDNMPSPQITVYPPAYTDLPSPAKLLPGLKHLEVYAGTRAVYRAKADRPLTQALIRWQPEDPTQLQLAQMGAGAAVSDKAIAKFDEKDKSVFTIDLFPWASGTYVLYMRDQYGLETEETADIRVVKDPVPVVKLLRPAASAEFAPDAVVPFKFFVSDEKFAVQSVFVEFRRKAHDGKDLDDNATRVVLYDAQTQGKIIPWQLAQALGFAPLTPDLRLRQTKLSFDMAWALKNHKFKEGETVVVEVCADDFCDIYPKGTREPGRSHAIELRIVSKREIIRTAQQKLAQIQRDLENAAKLEQKALDTVRDISKEKKIDQAVRDRLIDGADVPQKDVREIVGMKPEDGIRGELKKLRETLKANNLENTRPFEEAGKIKGALENIAQEELPKIEPNLYDIRADLNRSDKIDPKIKTKLDATAQLQQNVADTLNELIAKMDPGAKMRDIKIELSDIVGKQQQLHDEMQKLNGESKQKALKEAGDRPAFKKDVEDQFKKKIEQKAQEQKDLSQRLEKLVKEMEAEKKNQDKLGNKKEAEQIQKALDQLQQKPKQQDQKLPLNAQMKDVANQLKDKGEAPPQALDQQQNIAKDLAKALDELEGRDPNLAQKEIKDRKDAAKEIDRLARKNKELREKAEKVEQIKDMQERLKKQQEIAQELGNLQNEIEKARRQVARLQEQQPANDLKQAADEVAQAAKKMQQGEDGGAEQQKAGEHLREAKNLVKDSEEQLARELLIKMHDQLKGLKERQDATLKRTEDLHPKVMKRKSWTGFLLESLGGNIDAQKGIAEDTEALQEKLKGAVVFGGILERAKKSMDSAGTIMEGRKGSGKERCFVEQGNGELMDADVIIEENGAQKETVQHQKQAARSLTNLLDALKEEIDKPKKDHKDNAQNPEKPDNNEDGPKGGVRNQDGIPPKAQLKALKAEQLDLNERTIDFDTRNPDRTKFTDRERAELRELERQQRELERLFQELTRPPQQEGDQP